MLGYLDAMLRYFELSGRTTRTQYWVFQLVMVLLMIGAVVADIMWLDSPPAEGRLGFFALFAVIVHTVPSITVTVRRLHDGGRSGWWYWIQLIPIVGAIWLLVLMFLGPNDNAHRYGEDPRDSSGRAAPVTRSAELLASMQARRHSISRI